MLLVLVWSVGHNVYATLTFRAAFQFGCAICFDPSATTMVGLVASCCHLEASSALDFFVSNVVQTDDTISLLPRSE